MRVTRQQLEQRVKLINKTLLRPTVAYQQTETGSIYPQGGHLTIDSNSPGDGVTRFRLSEILASGGQSDVRNSVSLGAAQFDEYLCGVLDGIELLRGSLKKLELDVDLGMVSNRAPERYAMLRALIKGY